MSASAGSSHGGNGSDDYKNLESIMAAEVGLTLDFQLIVKLGRYQLYMALSPAAPTANTSRNTRTSSNSVASDS